MNKLITHIAVVLFFILSVDSVYSIPPTFNMTINHVKRFPNNITGADSVIQFDVNLLWTNSGTPGVDPFEYGSNRLNITFNPAIANGGTLTASRITSNLPPGSLPYVLLTPTVQVILNPNGNGNMLFQGSSIVSTGAHNFIISDVFPGTCIGRYRIRTSSHTLTSFVSPDFRFQLTPQNNTFAVYLLPPADPKDPDNQLPASLLDTIANHYGTEQYSTFPRADFYANNTNIIPGGSVNFFDYSISGIAGDVTSWTWSFPGGVPSSSTARDPVGIVYNTPGLYTVTLTITPGSSGATKINYIAVAAIRLDANVIVEGMYNSVSNSLARKDTMKLYLRDIDAPFAIRDSAKAPVDSINFTGSFRFYNTPGGNYFIVVKHFNSMETWSKSGGQYLASSDTINNYDFTSSASQAYGNNLILKGTKYCIYSGDIDQDNSVRLNDLLAIYNRSLEFNTGTRLPEDLTGDSVVNLADITLCFNNVAAFVAVMRP